MQMATYTMMMDGVRQTTKEQYQKARVISNDTETINKYNGDFEYSEEIWG